MGHRGLCVVTSLSLDAVHSVFDYGDFHLIQQVLSLLIAQTLPFVSENVCTPELHYCLDLLKQVHVYSAIGWPNEDSPQDISLEYLWRVDCKKFRFVSVQTSEGLSQMLKAF
ncbi:hypothetical protein J6590_040827 [Homalodisca vitripennis]|nr:hypothetical protein J6590_040827 [Homalodisca vitripennis]